MRKNANAVLNLGNSYVNIGLTFFWSILFSFLWQSEVADSIGRTDSVVVGRNQAKTPGVVNLLASFSSIKNKDKTSYLAFWHIVNERNLNIV